MTRRGSGLLHHITSLPAPFGVGDLGPWAYRFADFLSETKQHFWQMLPLNPTDPTYDHSPYHSTSAFAGNPLLISPELMARSGLLLETDIGDVSALLGGRVDYGAAVEQKARLFTLAYERFKRTKERHEYETFCSESSSWLDDFALFVALKAHFRGQHWSEWPPQMRDRHPRTLQSMTRDFRERIEMEKFLQYIFIRQWRALKEYCNEKGIQLIGDIPMYVAYDSADVWTTFDIFKLDTEKKPYAVAGVPPDYFSETGQLWGNPVYRWDVLKERRYDWWVQRIEHTLSLFDVVRVDHFRGFVAYWEIDAGEKKATNGKWVKVPVEDFFGVLLKRFSALPIIAEDLGVITPDVRKVMHRFRIPGMKVLLFAFGGNEPMHPYLPHTYQGDCVVYTGTHDTNTVRGWFETEAQPEEKVRLSRYIGRDVVAQDVHWELIRLAMMSVADLAIIPTQDILGLGSGARMNRPATKAGNWLWHLAPERLTPALAEQLARVTETYGRG